jgi:hypothetical protein
MAFCPLRLIQWPNGLLAKRVGFCRRRFATRMTGMYYPNGHIFFGMRLLLLLQKRKSKASIERILSWEPERIVIGHRRCFVSNVGAFLRRLFGSLL